MQVYQQMLNVTGNNIANADTVGFKESRTTFTDIFSRTLRQGVEGSGGAAGGGVNPIQIGQGVTVASVDKNMSQGGFTATEKDFDLAIDGEGFFTVNDGTRLLYTRDGSFAVDANGLLVDASTGYLVQRIGITGEDDGFQDPADTFIRIPYNTELPGTHTTTIDFIGNLSAGDTEASKTKLQGGIVYQLTGEGLANEDSDFSDIIQLSGFAAGDTIDITGRDRTGTIVSGTYTYAVGDTLQNLLDEIETTFGGPTEVSATIEEGRITVTDANSGYSMLDVDLSCSVSGLEESVPSDFDYLDVGGAAAQTTNITIYDRQGETHSLTATFVRQSADRNVWDLVINSCADADEVTDRRTAGITFDESGTYQGVTGIDGFDNGIDAASNGPSPQGDPDANLDNDFAVKFPAIASEQVLVANLGRSGYYDGVFQLGGDSDAGAIQQDGYGRGSLQSISIDGAGVISGTFSNGINLDIASLRIAVFDNVQGLQTAGANYYDATKAVGATIYTQGMQGRAGRVRQSVLEDSNVDIASQFTRLIVAQRGFQMNSRTVSVTTDMFQELTRLVM
jgi:flagellar hook protein FlgE